MFRGDNLKMFASEEDMQTIGVGGVGVGGGGGAPNWSSPAPNGFVPFPHGPPHGNFPALMPHFPAPTFRWCQTSNGN